MKKYHIDKNGNPARCRATVRTCPLGGPEAHFNSLREAEEYAEEKHKSLFGILGAKISGIPDESIKELVDYIEDGNSFEYMMDYYHRHPYLSDSFESFGDSVYKKISTISRVAKKGKMSTSKANMIAEQHFVTATSQEMVEVAALWRPAFKSKEDFELVLKTYANSNGISNGRLL